MENSLQTKKNQANLLRKSGSIEEALLIYQELWKSDSRDKFDTAGYLHCLRKLKKYEEALVVANKYVDKYLDFSWFRNEVIWTYIGVLRSKDTNASISSLLPLANKITSLNPDDMQKNTTVLFVLKKAKQFKKWDVVTLWVDKINPISLEKVPLKLQKGKTDWSNHLIWHHYKVKCLIHQKKYQKALDLIWNIKNDISRVKKYFDVLEAQAYYELGKKEKSIEVISSTYNRGKVDWWIVRKHGIFLRGIGQNEQALEKMYEAAALSYKLEGIVTLILEIGLLCKELERYEESYYHLMLYRLIREKNNWEVKDEINRMLEFLSSASELDNSLSFKEVLSRCQNYWNAISETPNSNYKSKRTGLTGNLIKVKEDKPYCFIKSNSESFFCYKSDIACKAEYGLKVSFDVIPSFDKKKKKDSWKAINITCYK
ncbi:tetratricopeptide repeat protein [Oceanobacillus profundus]|uniref:tetratricopeptide repeat protein n=1 Tax=Oceanobacillus profundus TaxID=372463 RepID=UPI003634A4DD